jgi:hypothetical protein
MRSMQTCVAKGTHWAVLCGGSCMGCYWPTHTQLVLLQTRPSSASLDACCM